MQLDTAVNGQVTTVCHRQFPLNVWDRQQDPVLGDLIALDTETELIKDHTFPHLVLLQVTAGSRIDLVCWQDAEEYMRRLFRYNPSATYVLVNAAYDMGVLNLTAFYDLVDTGQVVNLQDRYKLWDISERGYVRKPDSLANMAQQVLGEVLPKDDELRLKFDRNKSPSTEQLLYGAKDVAATWVLGNTIPAMPTEADSQIMGSIVLDAISRRGMLVDKEHFHKTREKFIRKTAKDLEFLELRGYNPLLGKPSTHVLQDGLEALGITELPGRVSGMTLEYMLYRLWICATLPLDKFICRVQMVIREIEDQDSWFLSNRELVDWYVTQIHGEFEGRLKADRLANARASLQPQDLDRILEAGKHQRINPFKGKNRQRLDELTRGVLDSSFLYDTGLGDPVQVAGIGLSSMARDTKLCMWPLASVLRELMRAKAGKILAIPEFSIDAFRQYIVEKSRQYGDYSTEWSDCMKPEAFMQARLDSIERKNPGVVFPRTDGGKEGKNKKIQVSSKDKWIFKVHGIEDALVETYVSYKHNEKIVSTYLNPRYIKEDGRVHTRFENYVRTGRTASSGPNVQNVPGSGGIRQMYVPPPMHLLASVDYSQLELCSLSQHCYTTYGHSKMRELINADIDLHSWFAGRTAGLITEENDYDGSAESREAVIVICNEIAATHKKLRKNAKACYSADTELLTPSGWRRIDELYGSDAEVMQYDPGTKEMTFAKPLHWIKQEDKELIHFQHSHMDSLVTPDHRMLVRSRDGVCKDVLAEDMEPSDNWQTVHAGYFKRKGTLNELETRLAVMIQADGSLQKNRKGVTNGVALGFRKQHKIERASVLLDRSGWKYTQGVNSNGVHLFRIAAEELDNVFRLLTADREFLDWSAYDPDVFIEELALWDSRYSRSKKPTGKRQYATVSERCADVAQLILITNGIRSNKRWEPHDRSEAGGCWIVNWYQGTRRNYDVSRTGYMKKEKIEGKHTVYCLTVPSSYVVTRRGACCNLLGQCNFGFPGGMADKKFLSTQRGFGNTEITLPECTELRNNWFLYFPEMAEHMTPLPDIVTDYDRKRLDNPNLRLYQASNILGVLRRKCSFNSACNFPFQSLAALGAKRALWAVWRSRYGKYMCNFVHDEIIFELPAETAADDVRVIQKIMVDAMKQVLPDVKIAAEGCLMERWDKNAEPVYDEFGNLTVWRPEVAQKETT